MVGSDGFSKFSNVSAHSNKVLPDVPVFIVALQGFLQCTKGFVSANKSDKKEKDKQKMTVNEHGGSANSLLDESFCNMISRGEKLSYTTLKRASINKNSVLTQK